MSEEWQNVNADINHCNNMLVKGIKVSNFGDTCTKGNLLTIQYHTQDVQT